MATIINNNNDVNGISTNNNVIDNTHGGEIINNNNIDTTSPVTTSTTPSQVSTTTTAAKSLQNSETSPTGSTITVTVGGSTTLSFNPPFATANVEDTVLFLFRGKNHSVVQSTFSAPCLPLEGGVNSGYQPNLQDEVNGAPTYNYSPSTDGNASWFFCAQDEPLNHCQKGMVFAVNPASSTDYEDFRNRAVGEASSITASANATATSAAVDASLPKTTVVATRTADSSHSNNGTSSNNTGRPIGIGIGVASALIAVVAFCVWFVRTKGLVVKLSRRKTKKPRARRAEAMWIKPELEATSGGIRTPGAQPGNFVELSAEHAGELEG